MTCRFCGGVSLLRDLKVQVTTAGAMTARGRLALEDGDFAAAADYFERALDIEPFLASAYMGKLLAELKLCSEDALENSTEVLEQYSAYQKAVRFARGEQLERYGGYARAAAKNRAAAAASCEPGKLTEAEVECRQATWSRWAMAVLLGAGLLVLLFAAAVAAR